jgi:hypothetical protein
MCWANQKRNNSLLLHSDSVSGRAQPCMNIDTPNLCNTAKHLPCMRHQSLVHSAIYPLPNAYARVIMTLGMMIWTDDPCLPR